MNISRSLLRRRPAIVTKIEVFRFKSNLAVGVRENVTKTFTQAEVNQFADISGDKNPLHIDHDYAISTGLFTGTIVHGALLTGLVSSLLGTKLPGPGTVVFNQSLKFPSPLYVGKTVHTEVTITDIKKKFVVCAVECKDISSNEGIKVMTGKVTVLYLPPTD